MEEIVKKKRGRPKKIIPEEVQQIIDIVNDNKTKEEQEYHQIVEEVKQKYKNPGAWDVSISDNIDFFDSRLSYELTGYKPINKTKGLDFNPDWFRQDAIRKLSTGRYSPPSIKIGSKSHFDF